MGETDSLGTMLVFLRADSKHGPSRTVQLRSGQIAQFGKSGWADYGFPEDRQMAEIHFAIRCTQDDCRIDNLSQVGPTLVNGEEIQSASIRHQDVIQAGDTVFVVTIEGQPENHLEPTTSDEDVTGSQGAELAGVGTLAATCAYLELSDDVQELAQSMESDQQLIADLVQKEQNLDALRLRAYLLPKRDAVWWGCLCIRDELDDPLPGSQLAAWESATAWVVEPSEDHRRDCEQAADAAKSQGAGGMLALAAFWSEGSITSPSTPPVEADERLSAPASALATMPGISSGGCVWSASIVISRSSSSP